MNLTLSFIRECPSVEKRIAFLVNSKMSSLAAAVVDYFRCIYTTKVGYFTSFYVSIAQKKVVIKSDRN